MEINTELLQNIIAISHQAGTAILNIYAKDFKVELKADSSPLTKADLVAHNIITNALSELTPDIPVLSEESLDLLESGDWRNWETYWLIDPLDGTKEFVKRNGEFTVNIALIKDHKPVLGVIYLPVNQVTYAATVGLGAFKSINDSVELNVSQKIRVTKIPEKPYRMLISRSHASPKLNDYLSTLDDYSTLAKGSSIKACLIAEGAADCYPKFGPTSEWDTAAAQAIVEAAGGAIVKMDGTPLSYNTKDDILNPSFMVYGDDSVDWLSGIPSD